MANFATKYWQDILDLVENHGWAVASVMGSDESPSFSYSVGLCARGLPDLILIGVRPNDAQKMINIAIDKLIAQEFSGATGDVLTEVANLPLAPRCLSNELAQSIALGSVRYAQETGQQFRMIQLVLPDAAGLFPWDSGCDPRIVNMQVFGDDQWEEPAAAHPKPRLH